MQRYAEWGFDYVKIDWCHCEKKDPNKTYKIFGDALKQVPVTLSSAFATGDRMSRGSGAPKSASVLADDWRHHRYLGEYVANWFQAGRSCKICPAGALERPRYARNRVCRLGPAGAATRLKADEQYTHMSLWCLLSSPLLLGCDLTKLDDFTLNLITNDEVLAVNQDPLGHQADRILKDGDKEVWTRPLEDGSMAVGFFNRGLFEDKISISWEKLGLKGPQMCGICGGKRTSVISGMNSSQPSPHTVLSW